MGCVKSKPSKDQEIQQALDRIKEKEQAIDALIKQHEQIIQQSQKQHQPGQKYDMEDEYKQKINQRFDQLEKNLEKFNSDGLRSNTNSNNNNVKEGYSKSPSTLMQRQPPNNNNNNGNILFTEDIQVNSKNIIQSPPISISPNQIPNQMQLQRESSQQSQPGLSSKYIQHQPSLPQQQQQQQQQTTVQQQQQQQQQQQSQQSIKQQLFENGIHQQQQQQQSQEQMIFSQPKNKHPSRKSSDHRLTSPKRISMGSNGKIIKQQKANNNNQIEDEMQHWNNIIQALDDISIRPIDQFNENQPQQKNLFPSTDVLDFDIPGKSKSSNNNILSQLNAQTLPAQPQQQKNFPGVNSHEIQAGTSHARPKTSGSAVPLDQIIQNNPEINKIHQKVSNAILKNP